VRRGARADRQKEEEKKSSDARHDRFQKDFVSAIQKRFAWPVPSVEGT
jgi:hypothetical protein